MEGFSICQTPISGHKSHNFVGAVQPSAEADENEYSLATLQKLYNP